MSYSRAEIDNVYSALRLRNIVLSGVLFFLIFKTLLGFASAEILRPAYLILAFAFLLNFSAYLLIKSEKVLILFAYLQFGLDLIVILLALYFSGGIENTWGFLLTVVIVISGMYFSLFTALFISILAILAFGTMVWLQYLEIIPHFSVYGLEIWKNLPYIIDYVTAMFVLYLGAAIVSISAGYNFKKRREESEAYAAELNKKIKTIEEFNQELREKYADIEKLNKLFVGREMEMIRLKEENTRLRGEKR